MVQAQSNHIPLDTKKTELTNDMSDKGVHYYKINVGDDFDGKKDLVVTVKGMDSKSDPDLHISSTNQGPTSNADSEFSCAMVGEDICTIPSSALRSGKTFYVATKCYRKCSYSISASLVSEIELHGRKDYKIPMQAGDKRIFTFKNPHAGVKNLLFTARADRRTAKMRMYIKAGEDATPTTSDMGSTDGWEDGVVIKISESTKVKVEENQVYKILFESDDSVIANIRVDLIYNERLVEEGETIDDFVIYNEKTCYKYIVKTTDKNLRVGAYSFSGNPDIYVNPGMNPAGLSEYKFKATETADDVLVLTPEDREQAGAKKGVYFICVYGKSNSSYRFRIAESNQEFYLEDGIAETNEIKQGDSMSFYYTDSSLKRDLNLTFTLSVKSGPAPEMYIKSCGRKSETECFINSRTENGVTKAVAEVGTLYALIQHTGSQCGSIGTNPCTYIIEVVGASSDYKNDVTHFSLVAHHSETSHIKLREGISVEQIVENHGVRYFEFVVRDSLATKVSFTVNSHHGDADLYVSRAEKFPDSKNSEKKSARSRRFADEVVFEKEEDRSLMGVYYIAVQGFEYSSYSIRASIDRGQEQSKILPTQLSEGIALNEFISSTNEKKYYQFKTAMYGSSITDIRVSVTQVAGQFNVYIKNGALPTEDDFDYKSENGNDIIMRTKDTNFKAVGMKYVLIVPKEMYGTSSSSFRFSIKYTTTRSISSLRNDVPSFGTAQVGQDSYNYYKYVSVEKGVSYTISLTSLSGDANMVVSVDPAIPFPTKDANDYHSMKMGVDSISIKGDSLFKKNASCRPNQTSLVGAKPCEIYIGVYCNDKSGTPETREKDSCSYSLKIYDADTDDAHMLIDGTPQKDKVKETSLMYYFVPVEVTRDYLYIASTAETGDVKLYVNFGDQYEATNNATLMPNSKNHVGKSKSVAHSQTIHFSKKDLKKHCADFTDCVALIAVEGKDSEEYNEYSLVAYTHIPRLIENQAMVASIKEETMVYFTYKTYCTDCTVIISASAYSIEADIDLYINFGHKKDLPTKGNYDIKSETWFNEHIELDLDQKDMKKMKVKSMQDVFIIGVYAKEEATVSIEVEETTSRIKKIKHGKSIKVDQEPSEIRYFEYKHTGSNNLKFEVTGVTGSVEMRINKYEDYSGIDPEHKFLPKNDNTKIWGTHSNQEASIKIGTDDDDYCTNCVYLIGIESHSAGAKYIFEVQEEKVLKTQQIKLGVPVKDSVASDDYKQYMFVLDKQKKFRVSCPVYLGKVEFSVATDKEFDDVIESSKNGSIIIDDDIDEFEAGSNVYIRVHGLYDTSEFVLLATHHHSYSIVPDSYTQEFSLNPYDTEGINMIYYPPSINFDFYIQVTTLDDAVSYPVFIEKKYIKDIRGDNLEFPIKSDKKFEDIYFWDHQRGYFTGNLREEAERDDEFIYLIRAVPEVLDAGSLGEKKIVKFTVNVNSHSINLLSPNIVLENSFKSEIGNYKFYKFFAEGNSQIEIILTPCICDTDVFLFKSFENAESHYGAIDRTRGMNNGQKRISISNASGPYFLKVQVTQDTQDRDILAKTEYCAFQILFIDKEHPHYAYTVDQYVPENDGVVDYFWPNYRRIRFKWGNILKESLEGTKVHPSIASVWLVKNPSMYTSSVCGMKHAEGRGEAEKIEDGNTLGTWKFNPRSNSFTKKGRYATFNILASVNRAGAVVPYRSVRLWVGIPWWRTIPYTWYFLFFTSLCGLAYAAYYFRKKAKITQQKLDFEMNDIRNVARVGYADDAVESANLKRDNTAGDDSVV